MSYTTTHPVTFRIEIVSGRGITAATPVDYLQTLQLHLLFETQVIRSDKVDFTADPVFQCIADFTFNCDLDLIIKEEKPVLVYVTSAPVTSCSDHTPIGLSEATSTLLALAIIDFRHALQYSNDFISVELMSCEPDSLQLGLSAGLLFARLSLSPTDLFQSAQFAEKDIFEAMDKYQDKLAADSKEMYSTAKKWWSKAMKSNPYVKNRLNKGLKLLSVDESGQMKMVCHFISPIAPPRSLNGPRFAARLVSLIPYMKEPSLFGTKADACWSSTHAFLAKKCGSVEDHALLLCSLLLGWGLNAYVAMGLITSSSISENTNNIIPHTWVVTIDSPGAASRVVFWETITGQQYVIHDSANASSVNTHHYRELHALFRHDRYYLNMQRVPALAAREGASKDAVVSFNLSDQQVWNPFPFTVDASQTHPGCLLSLTNSSKSELALIEAELELEAQLKDSLAAWRGESGLPTYFDDALSTLLQPALAAYEFDRCTGVTFGNADFQASIKRYVRKGECFKAYPTCFAHNHAPVVWSSIKQSVAAKDIALARGTSIRHAIRAKIFLYAEGYCALWICIATCFDT